MASPLPVVDEVAELQQHVGDTVERRRDGARAGPDLLDELVVDALELAPALGPAGVRLAVGAGVAGVPLHLAADLGDRGLAFCAGAVRGLATAGHVRALEVGELPPERRVLGEVAEVALHRLLVAVEGLLLRPDLARQVDDRPVRLELRERASRGPRACAAGRTGR